MNQIPRRLSHCFLKGEPFTPGSEYVSYLDPDGRRSDYCPQCWDSIEKRENGHFWKGKIPLKEKKILPPDEKALQLFRQIDDSKLKYVLALYLLRKQQIVKRTQTLYEIPNTGEVFEAAKVVMSEEESSIVAEQLNTLLNEQPQK